MEINEKVPKEHWEKNINTKRMSVMEQNNKEMNDKIVSVKNTISNETNNDENKAHPQNVDDTVGTLYSKIQVMFQKHLLKERLLQIFLIAYGIFSLLLILLAFLLIDRPVDPQLIGIRLFQFILICFNVILIFLLAFTQFRIVSKWNQFHSNSHQTITTVNFSIIQDINTLLRNILFTIGLSLILLLFLGYIQINDGKPIDTTRPFRFFSRFTHILFLITYIIVERVQYRKWYKKRRAILEYEAMIEREIPGFSHLVEEMDDIQK